MTTYITQNGSRYEVNYEKGFWRKNNGYWEQLLWAYGIDTEDTKECRGWADVHRLPEREIAEGRHLYIGNGDVWWLTTPVKEIIEDGED